MKGRRVKVMKALKDSGLSPMQRPRYFLMTDAEDRVIWLPGIKRSEYHLLSPDSSRILRIRLSYE